MPRYDATLFDPPAPVAHVSFRHLAADITISQVPMLLDLGADVSLVPRQLVRQAGLTDLGEIYELVGFDGSVGLARAVHLDLHFLDRTFRGQFLLFDKEYGILGRDILNLAFLEFDGPNLVWQGK